MLSEADLAGMRACVVAEFPSTAAIRAASTSETDTGGEGEATWSTVATVPCMVLPVTSPGDSAEGGRQVDDERRLIRVPYDTAVTTAHQIRTGGVDYEVLSVPVGVGYLVQLDVQCKVLR